MSNGTYDPGGVYPFVVHVRVFHGDEGISSCSGILVTPLWVLTANHCFTGATNLSCVFGGTPFQVGNPEQFEAVVEVGPNPATGLPFNHLFGNDGPVHLRQGIVDSCSRNDSSKDIALFRLHTRVPIAVAPPLHPLTQTLCPEKNFTAVLVGYGRTILGALPWESGGNPSGLRNYKASDDWKYMDTDDGHAYSNFWTYPNPASYDGALHGDSGGPLIWGSQLCGVISRYYPTAQVVPYPAPQLGVDTAAVDSFNNGAFIGSRILDSRGQYMGECLPSECGGPYSCDADWDDDGVPDACDRCPHVRNSAQGGYNDELGIPHDDDGDGVDDLCDNCPPTLCVQRGLPPEQCANPFVPGATACAYQTGPNVQRDRDCDGRGDVCDNCPEQASANQVDSDGDGVGNACDNCTFHNAFRACKSNADCTATTTKNTPVVGDCIAPPSIDAWGKCHVDGRSCTSNGDCARCVNERCRVGGAPCTADAECPSQWCMKVATCQGTNTACSTPADCGGAPCVGFGKCSIQLDDLDQDGMGDPCDDCPKHSNGVLLANSNRIQEDRLGVERQGDYCEQVPLFTMRQTLGATQTPVPMITNETMFTASAGIGIDGTMTKSNLRFRWCQCVDESTQKSLNTDVCFNKGVCSKKPVDFEQSPKWLKLTMGAPVPPGGNPIPLPPAVFDILLLREFSDHLWTDDLPKPPHAIAENMRIGEDEYVFWYHNTDVNRTPIPGDAQSMPIPTFAPSQTAGVVWTKVDVTKGAYAGPDTRDQATNGELRTAYAYVTTPVKTVAQPPEPNLIAFCNGKIIKLCAPPLRTDWLVNPRPVDAIPGPLDLVGSPARLVGQPDGRVLALRSPGAPSVDVTDGLSAGVRALLADPGQMWLTPVEPGYRGALSETTLHGAAVPRVWTGTSSPVALSVADGKMTLAGEEPCPPPQICNPGDFGKKAFPAKPKAQGSPNGSASRPGDRTDFHAVLSGRQGVVYMAGGEQAGVPAGDVWRYFIDTDFWQPVAGGSGLPAPGIADPRPGRVLGLALDDQRGRLVILDEVDGWTGKWNKWKTKYARLLEVDVSTGKTTVCLAIPRVGAMTDTALVAVDGGSFLLVGTHGKAKAWIAYRFAIDDSGKISWDGIAAGPGAIADDPFQTSTGVLLPVRRNGQHELVRLHPKVFSHDKKGCAEI